MRELEEAPYTVVAEHEGWEERDYPPTRWVSTEAFDMFAHDGPEHYKVSTYIYEYAELLYSFFGDTCSLMILSKNAISIK